MSWNIFKESEQWVAERLLSVKGASDALIREVASTKDELKSKVELRESRLGHAADGGDVKTVEYPGGLRLSEGYHAANVAADSNPKNGQPQVTPIVAPGSSAEAALAAPAPAAEAPTEPEAPAAE